MSSMSNETRFMARLLNLSLLAATLLASGITAASSRCNIRLLANILASQHRASAIFAEAVPQGGSFGQGKADIEFPVNATNLPALCAVSINVRSSVNSSYNLGLFLPDQTWNSRLLATGNGGFGGGINWADMGRFSQYGFATLSTDTGHVSLETDGSWALNSPARVIDWGYHAMHGSLVLGKEIIKAYYRVPDIEYSYFAGCSTGGRQALKEIQLHPDSLDGIAIGAPTWKIPTLAGATTRLGLLNYPADEPYHIDPSRFPSIVREVVRQCDGQDGLVDGIVSDPLGCNFDFEQLRCGTSTSECFTLPQLGTIRNFYSDWIDANRTFVFPGMSLGADPTFLLSVPQGYDYYKYFVYNDPNWDFTQLSYEDIIYANNVDPGDAAADDYDLTAFMERGVKHLVP
ncbi:hypothetical protein O1611_g4822 [Lasiodiplodia mahajangana]|uniref:Uncharacterized protein n=1 Tax=Lasiodiplodia mahajangana TaxID=1108764 RepID=A0ACC2JNP4_9PEZI|nr:hypothetical protein O1611_g4822 [Lasiodiplodia mahajangana]